MGPSTLLVTHESPPVMGTRIKQLPLIPTGRCIYSKRSLFLLIWYGNAIPELDNVNRQCD